MNRYELFLLLVVILLIAAALVLFLPSPWSRRATAPRATRQSVGPIDRDDDRYWLAGTIYYNPDDPEPMVPKRFGLGWTLNLGHPVARWVMIGLVLLPVALAIIGVFVPGLTSYGCHPSGCHFGP